MQYGSFERRIAKESILDFDMCCISLNPVTDPILSAEGVLYDKTAVLEFIVNQKRYIKSQKKAYEEYLKEKAAEEERKKEIQKKKELKEFIKASDSVVIRQINALNTPLRSVRDPDQTPNCNRFWVAESARDSQRTLLSDGKGSLKRKLEVEDGLLDGTGSYKMKKVVEKPDKYVKCPISGKKLDFKELFTIKFRLIDPDGAKIPQKHIGSVAGGAHQENSIPQYCCAVSGNPLTNHMKLMVIRVPDAPVHVISESSFVNSVKPTMTCPFTNKPITMDQVVEIRRGATGFASTNNLQKTEKKVSAMGPS